MANKIAILLSSASGLAAARTIAFERNETIIVSTHKQDGVLQVSSLAAWVEENFSNYDALIFISSVGVAVRTVAPHLRDKYNDPAVIAVDLSLQFVVSVLSGHIGGANRLTQEVANILGAKPIVTTRSDNEQLWALDTFIDEFDWSVKNMEMNEQIALFVNRKPTALLLELRDKGTEQLEHTKPEHVDVFYRFEDIDTNEYELLITVSSRVYSVSIPSIQYHPKTLSLGLGCRKDCPIEGISEYISKQLNKRGFSALSIKNISTIELKKDEKLIADLASAFDATINIFSAEQLAMIDTLNPSQKVKEVTGTPSVSEASAILAARNDTLLIQKQKACLSDGADFTFALSEDILSVRRGHIEIVGAGPGDPELVSVRGRRYLEMADLILYAGSLVPIELTHFAKSGATVRSSASMNLEEQFEIMKEFYDKGELIVRLHTGDPCIYGAIQEQMALFDEHKMSYHITPGISSFQAAAAALRSQFTIPEKVQTIILTRGEGRTAMPPKEKLHLLARSQSTMCIFLSATVVDSVQKDLLEHYAPTTPVAVCYKLTWKDEKIFRGELSDLANIVKDNKLTLTTMIVVGEAIDNRKGLSRLYADEFKHIFRV